MGHRESLSHHRHYSPARRADSAPPAAMGYRAAQWAVRIAPGFGADEEWLPSRADEVRALRRGCRGSALTDEELSTAMRRSWTLIRPRRIDHRRLPPTMSTPNSAAIPAQRDNASCVLTSSPRADPRGGSRRAPPSKRRTVSRSPDPQGGSDAPIAGWARPTPAWMTTSSAPPPPVWSEQIASGESVVGGSDPCVPRPHR